MKIASVALAVALLIANFTLPFVLAPRSGDVRLLMRESVSKTVSRLLPVQSVDRPNQPSLTLSDRRSFPTSHRSRMTNVALRHSDLWYCDAVNHSVFRHDLTQPLDKAWNKALAGFRSVAAPCHTEFADINGDGREDVVVASLGSVWPDDSFCGRVVCLMARDDGTYEPEVIVDHLRRVADVRAADFDQDGDMDLVAAEFGYLHGRVLYLEQIEDQQWLTHTLLEEEGAIHVPVADFDNDGDLDVAALISQDREKVVLFENTGSKNFDPIQQTIWRTPNFDFGSSGMICRDLDQDGDNDLIITSGDNLEFQYPYPQPWHGCYWLRNDGDLRFRWEKLADVPGAYAVDSADLDHDGDLDLVVASMFNDWRDSGATSLCWLENDGSQKFQAWTLALSPTHLCTVSCGDLESDGIAEIAAGSLQAYPPYSTRAGTELWSVVPQNASGTETTRGRSGKVEDE